MKDYEASVMKTLDCFSLAPPLLDPKNLLFMKSIWACFAKLILGEPSGFLPLGCLGTLSAPLILRLVSSKRLPGGD